MGYSLRIDYGYDTQKSKLVFFQRALLALTYQYVLFFRLH